MENKTAYGGKIVGASEVGSVDFANMDKQAIHQQSSHYWDTNGNDFLGTIALPYYGAFTSEENCHLMGDIKGKKMLEMGCGDGQSLHYMAQRSPDELWGVDISANQLNRAAEHLAANGYAAKLICAAMEEDCGIPAGYFDYVLSIYAIGWTTDLEGTFRRIASYLKKGGTFIFSWSHPIHKCVALQEDALVFKTYYFDESWYTVPCGNGMLTLPDRKLSTYINALAKAGFVMEQMVEQSDEEILNACAQDHAFARKARMLPVAFVIKATKA